MLNLSTSSPPPSPSSSSEAYTISAEPNQKYIFARRYVFYRTTSDVYLWLLSAVGRLTRQSAVVGLLARLGLPSQTSTSRCPIPVASRRSASTCWRRTRSVGALWCESWRRTRMPWVMTSYS